ncbi:MAG: twin-arginine translocase subunit TatC [Myxococcales bacterium]|nr:twin-arginine translocase subunit TatC [Myxococcales bacterium]
MSFFDHLTELRSRLMRAVGSVALGFAVCYAMVDQLTQLLLKPYRDAWWRVVDADMASLGYSRLPDTGPQLQNLTAFESVLTDISIALIGALFIAAPIIFYQIWMFISPGLYKREKRLVVPFAGTSALMFAAGAVFCFYLVLPVATEYLLTYPLNKDMGGEDAKEAVRIIANYTYTDYIKYTTRLLLGFGLMFQFPLGVFFLAKAGIITHKTLLRHWKIMIVSFFIIGAFLTPPEPVSQVLMALPMCGLFFASIGIAYLVGKPERERMAKLDAELAGMADEDEDD